MDHIPSGKLGSLPLSMKCCVAVLPVPPQTPWVRCGGSWKQRLRAHLQALVSGIDMRQDKSVEIQLFACYTSHPFPLHTRSAAKCERWCCSLQSHPYGAKMAPGAQKTFFPTHLLLVQRDLTVLQNTHTPIVFLQGSATETSSRITQTFHFVSIDVQRREETDRISLMGGKGWKAPQNR